MGDAIAAGGPPDPAMVAALAAEHGLEMVDVPWIDDVVARYHLDPAAGECGQAEAGSSMSAFNAASSLCASAGTQESPVR